MQRARPAYIGLLIAAIAVFVVGVCIALSDLYGKVGRLEHNVFHLMGNCPSHDTKAH